MSAESLEPGRAGSAGHNSQDGRHLRRERNREAALQALTELLDEGVTNPTAADVAAKAGLSSRSLFRYFDDVADLSREAIERVAARVVPVAGGFAVDASLPLSQRVEQVAAVADEVYRLARTAGLAARFKAPTIPALAEQTVNSRVFVRSLLEQTFAPELAACQAGGRPALLAALELWCTFEAQHLLRAQGCVEGVDPVVVTAQGLSAVITAMSR